MQTEMKPEFYWFSDNSPYNPQFTYAYRIHARSEKIDRVCPECGGIERYPKGAFDVSVEEGSEYPDVLMCGEYPFLIVSQGVIGDWKQAGIQAFRTFPVGIARVDSKALWSVHAPTYYRVEIEGRCHIDLEASGLHVTLLCPLCNRLVTEPSVSSGFKMVTDSWDGSPLFRDPDLYPCVTFCTDFVLELAKKHHRTNFRFEPMQGPHDNFSRGIDYLKE